MRKVLLTGGTGLIGTQTIPCLIKAGFKVYVLTTGDKQSSADVTYVKANLFDKDKINALLAEMKPEYLLHYAWLSTGLFNDNMNFDFLTSSIDLLKAFHKNGGKRGGYGRNICGVRLPR